MASSGKPRPRLLVVTLAASLLLAACGGGGSGTPKSASSAGPDAKAIRFTVPAIDRDAPFPALSAGVLDALSADVPELAKHRDAILAAPAPDR